MNTLPLPADDTEEFKRYLTGHDKIHLSRLLLTNQILALERGQYSLAVLQADTAVELEVTEVVSEKLRVGGLSNQAKEPYEKMSFGSKLDIPQADPRSLETYFNAVNRWYFV